jgi:Holliday junction resolvase-like predicted endonuclease
MAQESILQSKILKWLRSQGYYAEKTIVATQRGSADIKTCVIGYFVAIEVKAPGKKLTDLQEYRKRQIEQAGGIYITAHTLEDVKQIIGGIHDRGKISL